MNLEEKNGKTVDDNGSVRTYCKPKLTEIPYLQMVRGDSCNTPTAESGEGGCVPDLFSAEYGE